MAWARFTADFDWPPRAPAHVAYKAGMRCNLPRAGLEAAVAAGKAVAIDAPSREMQTLLAANPRARDLPPLDGEGGSRSETGGVEAPASADEPVPTPPPALRASSPMEGEEEQATEPA